jgi:hypothetical protein
MNDDGPIYGVSYPPELAPLSAFPLPLTMFEITDQGSKAKTLTTAPPAIGIDGSLNFASPFWMTYKQAQELGAAQRVLARGDLTIIKPLAATAWGTKDFYIDDPDGYIICFGGRPAADVSLLLAMLGCA